MNSAAIVLGTLYGILAAAGGYVLSQLAAGLLARSYYRSYARALIGVSALMVLAPIARGLAEHVVAVRVLLALAGYAGMATIGWTVVQFNRRHLSQAVDRPATACFLFGTLAYALLIAMSVLHFAALPSPRTISGEASIGAGHYAPLVLGLAALLLHTDFHVRRVTGRTRTWGQLAFAGYACSFVAVALSTLPYFGAALADLHLRPAQELFLENFSCLQTLVGAGALYGALAWHTSSIAPLYLMLLAVCGAYHVAVSQWIVGVGGWGPLAWGLAGLPLAATLDVVAGRVLRRERARELATSAEGSLAATDGAAWTTRGSTPFLVVSRSVLAALLTLTLWTRLHPAFADRAPLWSAATLLAYAGYFAWQLVATRHARYAYATALLVIAAVLLGTSPIGAQPAPWLLAGIGVAASAIAAASARWKLSRGLRTALADSGLVAGSLVLIWGVTRRIPSLAGGDAAWLATAHGADAAALVLVAVACAFAGWTYRSRLPVYAAIVALFMLAPWWAAGLALGCALASAAIARVDWAHRRLTLEPRLALLERWPLSTEAQPPALFVEPLSQGILALAGLGLAACSHQLLLAGELVADGGAAWRRLLGVMASSVALGLTTRTRRQPWVWFAALASGALAVHGAAHRLLSDAWDVWSLHALTAAVTALIGTMAALVYRRWCAALLRRVAESEESAVRAREAYYAGILMRFTLAWGALGLGLLVVGATPWEKTASGAPGIIAAGALICHFVALAYCLGWSSAAYLASATFVVGAWRIADLLVDAGMPAFQHALVMQGAAATLGAAAAIGAGRAVVRRRSSATAATWDWPTSLVHAALGATAVAALDYGAHSLAGWAAWRDYAWMGASQPAGLSLLAALAAVTFAAAACACRRPWLVDLAWAALFGAALLASQQRLFPTALPPAAIQLVAMCAGGLTLGLWFGCQGAAAWVRRRGHDSRSEQTALVAGTVLAQERLRGFVLALGFAAAAILAYFNLLHWQSAEPQATVRMLAAAAWTVVIGLLAYQEVSPRLAGFAGLLATLGGYAVAEFLTAPDGRAVTAAGVLAAFALTAAVFTWFVGAPGTTSPTPDRARRLAAGQAYATAARLGAMILTGLALAHVAGEWFVSATPWALLPAAVAPAAWLIMADERLRCGDGLQDRASVPYAFVSLAIAAVLAWLVVAHLACRTLWIASAGQLGEQLAWHAVVSAGATLVIGAIAALGLRAAPREPTAADASPALMQRVASSYAPLLRDVDLAAAMLTLAVTTLATIAWYGGLAPLPFIPSVGRLCWLAATLLVAGCLLLATSYRDARLGFLVAAAVVAAAALAPAWLPTAWQGVLVATPAMAAAAVALLATATVLRARPAPLPSGEAKAAPPLAFRSAQLAVTWSDLLSAPFALSGFAAGWVAIAIAVAAYSGLVPHDAGSAFGTTAAQSVALAVTLGLGAVAALLAAVWFREGGWTYAACGLMWATAYPLAWAAGTPPLEIGPWLTVAAAALWGLSRAVGKPNVSERRALATTIFARQFVRCSAVLALVAIAHAFAKGHVQGWPDALPALIATCVGGAATLLLAAETLEQLTAARRARLLVYLACLAGTGAGVAAAKMEWGASTIDAALAIAGLTLASGGGVLLNRALRDAQQSTTRTDRLRTFGSPMAHLAPGIAAAAVLAAVVETAAISRAAHAVDPRSCIVPLTAGALVCLTTVRAARSALWLHIALLTAGAAALAAVVVLVPQADIATWLIGALLVMHGVLASAWLVRRRAAWLGRALGIDASQCELPFVAWPALGGAIALAAIASCWIAAALAESLFSSTLSAPEGMLASVLAMGLFAHGALVRPATFWAHGVVPAATLALLWSTFAASWAVFPPDLALTLAAVGWATAGTWLAHRASRATALERSGTFDGWSLPVMSWSIALGVAAATTAVPLAWNFTSTLPHVVLTWGLLAIAAAAAGYAWAALASEGPTASSRIVRGCVVAEWAAGVLGIAAMGALALWMHRAGPLRSSFDSADALPTFALLGAMLGLGYLGASVRLRRTPLARSLASQEGGGSAPDLAVVFRDGAGRALDSLAAAALALASGCLVLSFGVPASATAALAFPLAAAGWVAVGWRLQRGAAIYLACAAAAGGAEYVRSVFLGLKEVASFERAFACLGASLLLYGAKVVLRDKAPAAYVLFGRPLWHVALAAPAALAVVAPHGSHDRLPLSLLAFAAGALYALYGQAEGSRPLKYVAAALFNVAIYLWAPLASSEWGVLQLYVIPAALTVLVMSRLHSRDLQPSTLSTIRFLAVGAILGASTVDVFFARDQNLVQFVVVLALSLTAIGGGIALRVRPFVLVGLAFVVLNVLAQLGMSYQHQSGVARAAILIGAGLAILAAMTYFNFHREKLLRRYEQFLHDPRWQ